MSEVSVGVVPDEQDSVPQSQTEEFRLSLVLKRWLREPLLHFLLLGVALFAVYAYMQRGRGGVESSQADRAEPRRTSADGHVLRVAMASPADSC